MNRNLFLFAVSALLLAGVSAHAGFEWVPAQTAPSTNMRAAPVSPVTSSTLTPMPGDTVVTTQSVTQTTSSVPIVPSPAPVTVTTTNVVPMPPVPSQTIAWSEPTAAQVAPPIPASVNVSVAAPSAPTPLTPPPAQVNVSVAAAPAAPQPRASIPDPLFAPAVSTAAPRELIPAKPKTDVVEGFGRDVPLTVATQQIVPSDYSVQYAPGVDPSSAVTWQGGRSWKTALQDSLNDRNLKATIVADSVLIEPIPAPMVAEAPAPPAPVPAPMIMASHEQPAALNEVIVETRPGETTSVTTTTTQSSTNGIYDSMGTDVKSPVMQAAIAPVAYQPAPVAAAAAPVSSAVHVWVAPRASTLRQVLADWSQQAGVQLQWSAQYDYPLMSDVQISGSFETAVETLLSGLIDAQPRPVARLHPNEPIGPAILVVETRHILE